MSIDDKTRCHDDACPDAHVCWRYNAREDRKWAKHRLTLRKDQDLLCNYFVPDLEVYDRAISDAHEPKDQAVGETP
jgi:hypothetical protein